MDLEKTVVLQLLHGKTVCISTLYNRSCHIPLAVEGSRRNLPIPVQTVIARRILGIRTPIS